jgi:hypothetical protein
MKKIVFCIASGNLVQILLESGSVLDPDPHSSKMQDPDPHITNADPKHWMYQYNITPWNSISLTIEAQLFGKEIGYQKSRTTGKRQTGYPMYPNIN